MCEILLSNMNKVNPDDDEKDRWLYKRGDMVVIKEDDHVWGRLEGPPDFYLVKIPLIPRANVAKYVEQDGIPREPGSARRKWGFKWDTLPQSILNKFGADGELTIKATDAYTGDYDYTWAEVRGYIVHKKSDIPEDLDID